MIEILVTLIVISTLSYLSYRWIKHQKRLRKDITEISNKIENIIEEISTEIDDRTSKPYFDELTKKYQDLLIEIENPKSVSNKSLNILKDNLSKCDSFYVEIRQNLRFADQFEDFKCSFSNKKRKYRTTYNKSVELIDLMNEKYNNLEKYITKFRKDYDSYKENEINDLNKMVKEANNYYDNGDFEKLQNIYTDINKLDCVITMQLNEPKRLRDKFISSEDNISQLEEDIVNKEGSLYHKVFNIIKNNKVNKEDTEEWNRIKRNINSYKKNKLLKSDIIDSSQKLNKIINDMSDLNYKIRKSPETVKINN